MSDNTHGLIQKSPLERGVLPNGSCYLSDIIVFHIGLYGPSSRYNWAPRGSVPVFVRKPIATCYFVIYSQITQYGLYGIFLKC